MRPRFVRYLLIVASAVLALLAFMLRPVGDVLRISYVVSTDAFEAADEDEEVLEPLIEEFNSSYVTVDGKVIQVDAEGIASGDAASMIAREELKPVAWTPASSLWAGLLNFEANQPRVRTTASTLSLVESPQVLAMWEQHARALDLPTRRVGWNDILRLSEQGWRAYGRPDWGPFLLGHTNPEVSTSGLSAAISMYYAFAGKTEGLSLQDVNERPVVSQRVRTIEQSVVHYGRRVEDFLEQLCHYGEGFAHALYIQETSLVTEWDSERCGNLVPIYPEEGSLIADYPLLILEAPWVSAEEREAARAFGDWLSRRMTPTYAARYGFRVHGFRAEPPIPNPEPPATTLEFPEGSVISAVQEAWRRDRKPANGMLVIDTSTSMGERRKLNKLQEAFPTCLDLLVPKDRVGLMTFSDAAVTQVEPGLWGAEADAIKRSFSNLVPAGRDSVLYDAILEAVLQIRLLGNADRINAVMVLTDGRDNGSSASLGGVTSVIRCDDPLEELCVRVFTVAYGTDADEAALRAIAEASQGLFFQGDQADIERICRTVFYSF